MAQDLVDFADWIFHMVLWAGFTFCLTSWIIIGLLKVRQENQEKTQAKEIIGNHIDMILHTVVEEIHNDIHYWFDKEDQEFLAQGKTIEDIVTHIKSRFKDHIFIVKDKYVFAGPDFVPAKFNSEDEITEYVTRHLLARAGIQVDK